MIDDGGHLFLLFNLDREAIKPAQSKFTLKQFQCDALERNQTLGEFTVKKALVEPPRVSWRVFYL
ncbi:hypothetical protein [Escherichia coli]